jgi:beta-lactamase class A
MKELRLKEDNRTHRPGAARRGAVTLSLVLTAVVAALLCLATASVGATSETAGFGGHSVATAPLPKIPASPVGDQLRWLLGIPDLLPLSTMVVSAHFDTSFLDQVTRTELNQALESLGPPGSTASLHGLSDVAQRSLVALVQIGPGRYLVDLAVDRTGLIEGLFFKAAATAVARSWSQIEHQVASIAPDTSFLAAKVNKDGTCVPVQSMSAETPGPLASMFKLFVLGALAHVIVENHASWTERLTVTAAVKVGESGTLQNAPDGTRLTVEETADKMISISDNTAADMLLRPVGRSTVENQVRTWSSHPELDSPFLSVSELFALKYHDFPSFADHYLALSASKRAEYLVATVDKIKADTEQSTASPRDINSIEWFASADDLCRALAGLAHLQAERGMSPIGHVLSINNGGITLNAKTWPRVWFKGGSEPGMLTLGYLARDNRGQSFAVIMLTEDTTQPVQESTAVEVQALGDIFGCLQAHGLRASGSSAASASQTNLIPIYERSCAGHKVGLDTRRESDVTPPTRDDLGMLIRAPSLGRGWLSATCAVLAHGHRATYDGSTIVEIGLLDLAIDDPNQDDGLIEALGDHERLEWMKANFADRDPVAELGGAASYATRLYDYDGCGSDQVSWVTERLRADPGSRSAIITTLQPLSDTSYVPCVSLLQFWIPSGQLELIVTAHSIDLGTKGYANLVELAAIQARMASALSIPVGRLIMRITSAHVYERDLLLVNTLLAASDSQ